MNARISDEQLRAAQAVDLAALVSRYGIALKRRGRAWWACCPFWAS